MSKPIPLEPSKTHVFIGTANTLTTHSGLLINTGSTLLLKGAKIIVEKIIHSTRSTHYKNNHFYELKFKSV